MAGVAISQDESPARSSPQLAQAGAFLMAVATRTFLVESSADAADTIRHLVGGATALGCTIGQGITSVSTLARGSA